MSTTAEFSLPKHVRVIHDAIARHPRLLVLADGSGGVHFKGYCRTESTDEHFIRVHKDLLRGDGGPNSGCLIIHNDSKLGANLAQKVRKYFANVCVPMPPGGDNASFRHDVREEEIADAIRSFGDDY